MLFKECDERQLGKKQTHTHTHPKSSKKGELAGKAERRVSQKGEIKHDF
jgi:hypothetical protein